MAKALAVGVRGSCVQVRTGSRHASAVPVAPLPSRDYLRLKRQLEHADAKHHPQDCGLQPAVHRKLHTGFDRLSLES